MRRHIRLTSSIVAVLLAMTVPTATASETEVAEHTDNIEHLANIPHVSAEGEEVGAGSDIEFATLDIPVRNNGGQQIGNQTEERTYALAGTTGEGLQIYDVTDPESTERVARYDCDANQGDIQVFERGERTFITYTNEDSSSVSEDAECRELLEDDGEASESGTFIIDITDPTDPTGRAFISVPEGSHNGTVDPSGQFFYNSNADLTGFDALDGDDPLPSIEYYDISDLDDIERLGTLALPPQPGLGTDSHDITFSSDGDRAYSAALSQTVILNTEDPADPSIVSNFVDPTINVEHQADPFTLTDDEGNERDYLIVEDEFIGALPSGQCPNGGVHVYDITGELEENPRKVGYWNVAEFRPATNDETGGLIGESDISRCTAHVFDIDEEEQVMNISFYNAGVRVVDISGLTGIGLGDTAVAGNPMRQVAFYQFSNSDTWASKTPGIEDDGSFFLFGNDQARGLDVYRYDATDVEGRAENTGTWMTPEEAEANLVTLSDAELLDGTSGYTPYCLLPGGEPQ